MSPGFVMDAGGLLALEHKDRQVLALLARAVARQAQVTVPAAALAQAIRRPVTQVSLMRLLRQPTTKTVALDRVDALRTGQLLAASGTSDIADAHVVVCAQRASQPVISSDPTDLLRLDPSLEIVAV
jgi:hypothetical protein